MMRSAELKNTHLHRGARSIDYSAFYFCNQLLYVELGAELETIGESAFDQCTSLRQVVMPSVIRIGFRAFQGTDLTELDLPEGLEAVEGYAFAGCKSLTRVSMPSKEGLIQDGVFVNCPRLARIDLIGEILEDAMKVDINQINRVLKEVNKIEFNWGNCYIAQRHSF